MILGLELRLKAILRDSQGKPLSEKVGDAARAVGDSVAQTVQAAKDSPVGEKVQEAGQKVRDTSIGSAVEEAVDTVEGAAGSVGSKAKEVAHRTGGDPRAATRRGGGARAVQCC